LGVHFPIFLPFPLLKSDFKDGGKEASTMTIKIFRGTKEVGGTCIEVKAANGKTLWIDLGLPLSTADSNVGYAHGGKPDALLISHSHQDHYGH
jgi:Cft2 family RNA processing exonuclease